ncbi:MAG: metallophosphoesterase family protein [Paludibacter sp.]|nr:metallophosphoesterase family protein [Paludibacter sp.]
MNRIYAIGDIHGYYNSLKELIENKIQFGKGDKLIFLGDYIDRGPDSKSVVDFILSLQNRDLDIVTLMGNHESMLLDVYNNKAGIYKWIMNGGSETLKSFNIDSLEKIEHIYINFFNNLKPYYALDDYLFVHAGFNDSIENPFSDNYSMLWQCKKKYLHPLLKDRTIIHGHVPVSIAVTQKQITNNSKIINVDGGKAYPDSHLGKLIACEVNTRTIFIA